MRKNKRAKRHEPKRSVMTTLRLTEDERASMEANAARAGMALSDFIRCQALDGKVVQQVAVEQDTAVLPPQLYYELNKIGVNINQIAHVMNAGPGVPSHLRQTLDKLNRILDDHVTRSLPANW